MTLAISFTQPTYAKYVFAPIDPFALYIQLTFVHTDHSGNILNKCD